MKKYKKRITDLLLIRKLEEMGTVIIESAKWCGKTITAEQIVPNVLYMSDQKRKRQNQDMSEVRLRAMLAGKTPSQPDERQLAPKLWDAVRFEFEHRDESGPFILTGSAILPGTGDIHHSGTGDHAYRGRLEFGLSLSAD